MFAQTCPDMPILNLNSIFSNNIVKQRVFSNHKSVWLSILHNPAKTACLGKISLSRYFEKTSKPIRLPYLLNLNIS